MSSSRRSPTDRPIGDPAVHPSVATAIFLDNREAVDQAVADGIAAGGTEERPASNHGFMYQCQLCDPDGNILEFGWMDPVAAKQGPGASNATGDMAGASNATGDVAGASEATVLRQACCGRPRPRVVLRGHPGLELMGERWALLVGPRRYGELAAGLPRIPSNILATRSTWPPDPTEATLGAGCH